MKLQHGKQAMKIANVLLALTLLFVFSGCGSAGSSSPSSPSSSAAAPAKEQAPSGQAAGGEATIAHALGTATIKETPKRVVFLYQGGLDISKALGVKPVGAVESTDQKPWFAYLGDMSGVENLGDEGQPNVEAIVALKPDLIVATKVRHEKIYAQLEAIAPTIVTEDLADWKTSLPIVAMALGKESEANAILQDWDARVAEFKKKMGDKLATTTVSLIRVQRDGSVKVYLKGFPGLMMKELGLAPPASQQVEFSGSGLDIASKEHIPQFDADYIFDLTTVLPGQENIPDLYKEWTSHPLWKELNAVKNGKLFQVDPIMWNFGAGPIAAKSMLTDVYRYFNLN